MNSNATEIVQTYVTYLKNATSLFLSKGAKVIISSPTPNNPWEFGNFSYTPTIFTYYSWYSFSRSPFLLFLSLPPYSSISRQD